MLNQGHWPPIMRGLFVESEALASNYAGSFVDLEALASNYAGSFADLGTLASSISRITGSQNGS